MEEKKLLVLGLGSNIGNRIRYLERAISMLSGLMNCQCSLVYESKALPCDFEKKSGAYFNMVVCGFLSAKTSPFYILHYLKSIESYLGRINGPKWSSRILDIDILLWGDSKIKNEILQIPHPGLFERDFVLLPLLDLMDSFVVEKKIFFVKDLIKKLSSSYITGFVTQTKCQKKILC